MKSKKSKMTRAEQVCGSLLHAWLAASGSACNGRDYFHVSVANDDATMSMYDDLPDTLRRRFESFLLRLYAPARSVSLGSGKRKK